MKTLPTQHRYAYILGILLLLFSFDLNGQLLRKDSVLSYQFQSATDSTIFSKEVCVYNNFEGTNSCYNFSICTYSTWDPFDRIWSPKSRVESKRDDNGKGSFTVYSNFNSADKKWINSSKEVNYEDPRHLIRENYEWDILNHRWMLQKEYIQELDKSKNVTLFQNKEFRKDEGIWNGYKEESVYDENGYQIEVSNANWSPERNVWEPNSRTSYELDSQGRRMVERYFSWDIFDQEWTNTTVKRNTYNVAGQIIKVSTATPFGNYRSEEEYTYNAEGSELSYMSFSSFPGSLDLEPSRKREQRYNPENKLVFSETSYWNSDSSVWVLEDRAVLNYDADSREIQRLSYGLSWGDTAVYLIWESQNEYSPEGNLLKAITYNYDESGFIWGGNRLNYEYDFEDRQIAQERWRWERESQMFLPNRRTETPYNGQGVIDRYLTFSWDTELSKWKGLGIIGWSDTGSESLVHFYRGIWNPNTEDWFITNTNLTYYGPCQQEQAFSPPESELRYYPNPVQSGILSFEMPIDQSYTLELMDLQGRVVFEGQIKGPFAEVELNVTSSGVYLIRLKNETEEVLDRIVVTNP